MVWALLVLSVVLFFTLVFQVNPDLDPYLMPSVVLLGWSICLLGISSNFRVIPQLPEEGTPFFRRVAMRIRYRIVWFWAVIFLLCSLILIYLSLRSVFIALAG